MKTTVSGLRARLECLRMEKLAAQNTHQQHGTNGLVHAGQFGIRLR
jgi:hypothetical protein